MVTAYTLSKKKDYKFVVSYIDVFNLRRLQVSKKVTDRQFFLQVYNYVLLANDLKLT